MLVNMQRRHSTLVSRREKWVPRLLVTSPRMLLPSVVKKQKRVLFILLVQQRGWLTPIWKKQKKGAKLFDEKLDERNKQFQEKKEIEKDIEVPQPKPYTLVLDEVINFSIVNFPGREKLAKFPISVAAILNSRSKQDRQNNPLRPSEMTVTLVQEPSTADGRFGVEAVVTFRAVEVTPPTTLAIEEPELDEEGKKVGHKSKLKRLHIRLKNIGKSREEISDMIKREEEKMMAEAEAMERAIVEAGVGRGYEHGAARRDIFQNQMFYDLENKPHYSRERRGQWTDSQKKDFLNFGAMEDFSWSSMDSSDSEEEIPLDSEKDISLVSTMGSHELNNAATKGTLVLQPPDRTEPVDPWSKVIVQESDTALEANNISANKIVSWSIEKPAKANPSGAVQSELIDIQMDPMWKYVITHEFQTLMLLYPSLKNEETLSEASVGSAQSSVATMSSEPGTDQHPDSSMNSTASSQPETLLSKWRMMEESIGWTDDMKLDDEPSQDALESQSKPPPSQPLDFSDQGSLEITKLRNFDHYIQERRQRKKSALPTLVASITKKRTSAVGSAQLSTRNILSSSEGVSSEGGATSNSDKQRNLMLIQDRDKSTILFLSFFTLLIGLLLGYSSRFLF
mmetsp:Transcript_33018/g.48203  ORF Transcript_33018/g.48203 Transcript_33018/m.48203 type:complete len:623 (-) Transcript_33018:79-1947(-)